MDTDKINQSQNLIPLFPLGVVLLPEMTMPLHIFEARYKRMINECLDHGRSFGIVYYDGNQMQKVGCSARVVRVIKRYEDGRMDIDVLGEKRFYIEHIDESRIYLQSSVLFIDDVDEEDTEGDETLAHEALNSLKHLDRIFEVTRDYDDLAGLGLKRLSFLICGNEGFTLEERQRFLEMTSARERLRKGIRVLKKVITRAQISLEVNKVIGGNGHIKALLAARSQRR